MGRLQNWQVTTAPRQATGTAKIFLQFTDGQRMYTVDMLDSGPTAHSAS